MGENTENNKSIKKKKKPRWWLRILIAMLLLLVVFDVFLIFFATPVIKTYIQNKVSQSTDSLFTIEFSKISFEISTRRVALKEFHLIADTAVYNKLVKNNKAKAALYNISCGSIELRGVGIYKLLTKRKLKAKELRLIDPIVELKKLPSNEKKQQKPRDFVHKDIYPAVSKYVNEFKIAKINLSNGKFLLNLQKNRTTAMTHIGYISVSLFDFLLNKQEFQKKERLFYSDDLQLNISEYRVNLSDNIHMIYADTVKISTKYSKLTAVNVGVEPISSSKFFLKDISKNYMKLQAPLVEFNNFNINELYFDHDINIGQIFVNNPQIKLVKKIQTTKVNNKIYRKVKKVDLTKLLKGGLNSVKIKTFKIKNAHLKYYFHNWNTKPIHNAKSLSLKLSDFDLNKNSHSYFNKIFYSDSLQLSIDTIISRVPDKEHRLLAKSIYVSTNNRRVKAKSISLKPIHNKLKHRILNIYIPSIDIAGVDFMRLYHKNVLNISNLYIAPSKFDIKLNLHKAKRINDSTKHKKQRLIIKTRFLKQIFVRNLRIGKSKFKIQQPENDSISREFSGNISVVAKRFLVNKSILSTNKHGFLFAEKFDIKLINYQQDLKDLQHVITAKSLFISNIDSLIEIDGLKIFKNTNEEKLKWSIANKIYDINFIQAFARGVDIPKVLNNDELIANSVSILRPNVNIYNNAYDVNIDTTQLKRKTHKAKSDTAITFRALLSKYFKLLKINTLNIDNANIKLADIDSNKQTDVLLKTKLSVRVNKFAFVNTFINDSTFADSTRTDSAQINSDFINQHLSYSDNISFRMTNYFSKLFSKNYQLKIKTVKFSSKDSVFKASIVRLFPDSVYEHSTQHSGFFTFYAPLIQSRSIDINQLLDSNIVNLGKLTINSPALTLSKKYVNNTVPINNKQAKTLPKRNRKMPHIIAQQINVIDGIFGIIQHSEYYKKLQTTTNFNMQINQLKFDSIAMLNPASFISKVDLNMKLTDIHHHPHNKKNTLDIDSVTFNNLKQKLNINNVHLLIKDKAFDQKISMEELAINKLTLSGLQLGELIINKKFIGKHLLINKPQITLFNNKSNKFSKKSKLSELNLYTKIKPSLKLVDIKKIITDSIKLNLITQEGINISNKTYNKMHANITALLIDSLHQHDGRLFSADDITFHIKNYNTNIGDSLYHLSTNDLGFSTGRKSIFAKQINIHPNYSRKQYANKVHKEFNLNYVQAKELSVEQVDLIELIDNENMIAKKINIDSIKYINYKNKKYALDSVEQLALPLDVIWKSKHLIDIDTIEVNNSYLAHEVLGKNARNTGFVDFTNVNIALTNLTNIPDSIKQDSITKLLINAHLMDNALLKASFHFPILSPIGEYAYMGNLNNFQMSSINPLIENLFFVSVKSGKLDSLNFYVIANDEYASGNMKMFYNSLKINLINKKKKDSLIVAKRGLFSIFANSIIRNKNKRFKTNNRIYFERNIYRSVINYWTLSILSGMRTALGFKSKQLKLRLKQERSFNKYQSIFTRFTKRRNKKQEALRKKQFRQELREAFRKNKK